MKARMLKVFSLLIAFSLLLSSLPVLSESAGSHVRTISAREMIAANPNLLGALAALPKKSGPIKSISATSSLSVQKNRTCVVTVKVKPANLAALNDLLISYDGSMLALANATYGIKSSTLTFRLTFQSSGRPEKPPSRTFPGPGPPSKIRPK